ncbi:MAG: universal stress protein, partial [Rhodospirillales bacterium]|nr:universal stress protein [Rhodospirillales bacterium]
MALKTIVVHLTNDQDHATRMEVAKSLAEQQGAFLTALYITRPSDRLQHIAGRSVSPVFLEEAHESAKRHAAEVEQEFTGYCEHRGIPHEWIVADDEYLDAMARHAHAADLLIVTRPTDQHLEDKLRTRLAEEVIVNSGLPVMVLPPGFKNKGFENNWTPKRVLIAWKANKGAVRAVRDSLAILHQAETALVGTVKSSTEDASSTLEIMQYLERQGIQFTSIERPEQHSVGETLLAMAAAHDCDLLIAGAYSRSRIREIL